MPKRSQCRGRARAARVPKYGSLLWVLLVPLAAQPAPLAFEDSVAVVARNNPILHAARANVSAAEQRVRAAYGGYLPQVSADVTYIDRSAGVPEAIISDSDYSTGITLTQNLFSGFEDQARVEQGVAEVDAAQAALALTKAQLSRDLKTAYAGLLYAQDNVALTEDILQRLRENLRLVELRYEGGRENKGSLLLTQASVAQARLDRRRAQQALASAQARLAAVLGEAFVEPRAVDAVPLEEPPATPDFAALARGVPDVRDAAARERSAAAAVKLSRAGFYPSVDVSGSVGRAGADFFPNRSQRSVIASVSIPLYSGGRDYHGVRSALAALEAAKASREDVANQVVAELAESYAAYVAAVGRVQVDRQFVGAAETRVIIARARYENGLISFEDWDRIENDLIQRRNALLVAGRERVAAEAAWELARGKSVIP